MLTIEHTTSTDDLAMEAVMDLAQEYQEYRQSILGGEASTDQLQTLLADRIDAITRQDLVAALSLDDDLEDAGMHPDYRITCYRCQRWAPDDHAHWPAPKRRAPAKWAATTNCKAPTAPWRSAGGHGHLVAAAKSVTTHLLSRQRWGWA